MEDVGLGAVFDYVVFVEIDRWVCHIMAKNSKKCPNFVKCWYRGPEARFLGVILELCSTYARNKHELFKMRFKPYSRNGLYLGMS